jgi:hypothetical protein
MNVDKLRQIIKEKGMFRKENSKNIICVCPYCGDHPNPRKKGHMYVSVKPEHPVVHCFYCNKAKSLPTFIFDITANKKISTEIISKEELQIASEKRKRVKPTPKSKFKKYNLPKLNKESFSLKQRYIEMRSNEKKTAFDFDNLIFDFNNFFEENNLTEAMQRELGPLGIKALQESMVGFITKNHSMVACRNINHKSPFKFRKLILQQPRFELLDYVEFEGGNPNSNLIVLSEGVYDAIGEMSEDSLKIFNKAKIYAAGLSYSYGTLIKSICFDHQLFNVDVVILSDRDKHPGLYYKLRKTNKHVINSVKVYYNRNKGGDFGSFPIKPFELKLERPRKNYYGKKRRYGTN